MNKFKFLKTYFSPFKRIRPIFYIGKIRYGTPYFFPRRWVKNKEKPGYLKAIPKKIGFDFVELGWKTKWTDTDYRFEWSPLISFVFFKWQIAIVFKAPEQSNYWESWLYYENNTDKSKSQKERIEQCQKEFKQNWISWKNGVETKTNYYQFIIKEKYLI